MKLTHKTIVITGGNSGIGFCLAKHLHANKNTITIVSRSQNNWETLQQELPGIDLIQCDLSNKNEVKQLAKILNKLPIELFINCAAVQYEPKITDSAFSFDGIEKEITTNFTAIVWLCHLLIPQLSQQPESGIVNLSSGLAIYPKSSSAVYCASKAALHSFSQSLRYQLETSQLQISEVILPLVDTPMTAGRSQDKKISAEVAANAIIHGIENGRDEIYVGKAKLLPIMSRVWPSLIKKILKRY